MADRRSSFDVPDQGDEPVVWDPHQRAFVPVPAPPPRPPAVVGAPPKQWFVGKDAVGKAPPPREGGEPGASRAAAAPIASPAPSPPRTPAPPVPVARRPDAVPRPTPAAAAKSPKAPRRKRRFLRVPKVRTILLLFGLFPFLVAIALGGFGWWYASSKFDELERVPVSSVLSPGGGDGINYLVVGSDSRDAVVEAGSDDPNVQPSSEDQSGQRSDTIIVLRVGSEGTKLLSIPRDLCIDPCDRASTRINAAFGAGPEVLIQSVQSALGIPIHHYMELDFASFAGLVDGLGGVPIDFPYPAFDDHSGLFVPEAGRITLDGQQALAFVRSRFYTEIIDGVAVEQNDSIAFPDVARGVRQQQFLQSVFGEVSQSRNPFTLTRSASALADGLRIDDAMTLTDALRLIWRVRGSAPASVALEPEMLRNIEGSRDGAAMLGFTDAATPVLDQFR